MPKLRRVTRRSFLASCAAGLFMPRPAAAEEPLRFVHAYGETVLMAPARRVVSLGYTTHDTLLALGVTPVALRYWFGNEPNAVWPWAQEYLKGETPTVLIGEVSIERVASLKPDLIVGIGSGISQDEYALLSRIAPVLMHGPGQPAYGAAWDDLLRVLGRAVGAGDLASELIIKTRRSFADARARHPDWKGRSAVVAYHAGGKTGAFIGADTRARFLAELGFHPPEGIGEFATVNGFYARFSPEDLSILDADVLIWMSPIEVSRDIAGLPMRKLLRAYRQGREVLAGPTIAAAMSFGSVLSLPYALSALEPEIEAAADGSTETPVPSVVKAGVAP